MGLFDKIKKMLNGEDTNTKTESPEEKQKQGKEEPKATISSSESSEATQILQDKEERVSFKLEQEEKKNTGEDSSLQETAFAEAQNVVELEELSINRIVNKLSALSYANIKLQKLVFHFRENRGDISSVQGETLFKGDRFLVDLKSKLEEKDIAFARAVEIETIFNSKAVDDFTPITNHVSVEVLTPQDIHTQKKAMITALSGVLEKESYEIESRKKPYLIGRGRNPSLPSGRMIKNDIVFIEPTQNSNEEEKLNRYVSRSILLIAYNHEINKFELGRTAFMYDSNHIVKINRLTEMGGINEIKVNTTKINIPLEDEDQIIINGKVNLLFEVLED